MNLFLCQRPWTRLVLLALPLALLANLTGCGATYIGQNQAPAPTKRLLSVAIAPQSPAIALGDNQQFSASALFSDGSKTDVTRNATWISAQPKVASINAEGMATAKAIGTISITAIYESVRGSSTLTIAPHALVSIAVTPQSPPLTPNHSVQLSALGTFTDGTSQDLSSMVTWSSTPNGVLTISGAGLATGNSPGTATVTASNGSITGSDTLAVALPTLVSIALSPHSITLTPMRSAQLAAVGTYSDASTQDISASVTWSASPSVIVTVSDKGLATGKALGSATITAISNTVTATDSVTVVAPTLNSISIAPRGASIPLGKNQQLSAIGTYSDASTQDISASVTWSASPSVIVAVSDKGLATGKALGSATITAISNTVTATDSVTVVAPTLNSISIAPRGASIPLGKNQQLSAIGIYSDGSKQDLTSSVQWSSSVPTILSLSSSGMATAAALGTATVTATSGTVSGADQLHVGPPIVVSFTVAPAGSVLAVGGREQLSAVARFSDGTTGDMTTSVSWDSANSAIANVSNQGLVLARHVGDTTISVLSDSVGGSANISVKPVLAVSYFSNAHTAGAGDATVRLTNPGVAGGNLCAAIYVFDQDQQLSECCGCVVSPDGLRTLSVNTDLTGNPLTGVKSTTGVVKIVSADPSLTSSCDPTAITPDASIVAWSTNIQKQTVSAFVITETSFQLGPLGDSELAALQNQCSFASTLGSGNGVCSCGTVAGGGPQ
jgi:hypothetical protein